MLLIGHPDGRWQLYTYKEGWLSVSPVPWDPENVSKENQVTIKCTQRFGDWAVWPIVYPQCKDSVAELIRRAVNQGHLERREGKKQFEILSADFLADTMHNVHLLEFNLCPVLSCIFQKLCL